MNTVTFIRDELESFRATTHLVPDESCGWGLVFPAGTRNGRDRYVVRNFAELPSAAYAERTPTQATLLPSFCMEMANRARAANAGVLVAHTHVGDTPLDDFSSIDAAGEAPLAEYFGRRASGRHFAALITGTNTRVRDLGGAAQCDWSYVGQTVATSGRTPRDGHERFERQIRAFGEEGQAILGSTKIAIVGLGGTGSLVAQQLAYLGVRDFLLVDPDSVERTNLNRLVGATESDIGKPKVAVAERHIKQINAAAVVSPLVGNVVDHGVANQLLDTDFIFACTDSHASRAVMNQVAYQYLIPCIDMGVAIHTRNGRVTHVAGRTQMLAPGLPCLVCGSWLDSKQVRFEMMSEHQLKQDPYFVGRGVTQPSVISLNGTMASLAVTMSLAALTGLPSEGRLLIYDGVMGSVRPTAATQVSECIVCSLDGALARGDNWPLPTRADS